MLQSWLAPDRPLLLDSGCGTGESSLLIADQFPEAQVLGIDQSIHRLNKTHAQRRIPDNLLLLHADVVDIWRWLVEQGFPVAQHFLLYPNPWPKSKHIQRRWHGSAALKSILQLGGEVTLRSNWQLYLQEFQSALAIAEIDSDINPVKLDNPDEALTPFEAKYQASNHELWELKAQLPSPGTA